MTRAVDDILVGLLPTGDQSALLEACLHSGARAHRAWARWCAGRPSPAAAICQALSASRTLLPLLERSVARNGLDLQPDVRAYVRAAALREELRADRYRRIAAEAIALLDRAGAAVFVARGAALAAAAYPAWALRHCHDLDLLVERDLTEAAGVLTRAGFAVPDTGQQRRDGLTLRHGSGLRIALHTRPFAVAHYDVSATAFAGAGREFSIDGTPARMPAPAASLVHVLGHATYSPSRRNLRWATDAWHLVTHCDDLDWGDVVRRLDAYRLALPVSALLTYLAALGVAVPPEVVADVRARAAAANPTDEDVALGGALAAVSGKVGDLWRAAPWPGRLRVGRWAVAPSPAYMRGEFRPPSDWLLSLCYVYRPVRFLRARLAARTARPDPEL